LGKRTYLYIQKSAISARQTPEKMNESPMPTTVTPT